ncbi:hypothetical protein [Deinococcus sp. 14RED07]|uniref:hypothetical protein n=1 Tax=Deinococcus sp. 14RED07 TaxID=2745874 RepID=UPI001E643FC8
MLHVSDWARSNEFYARVLGAEVIPRGQGFAYRFGAQQLNLHGPGLSPQPLARVPVAPGGSDLCFVWDGPVSGAAAHLIRTPIEWTAKTIQSERMRVGEKRVPDVELAIR